LLEQRALSEHSRVEELAATKLNMVRPSGPQDVVVQEP
jgi:cell division protein FtsL